MSSAKKHANHCVRCLRALGPAQVEMDSTRMIIGFYCLSTLDILGTLESATREDERRAWVEWIWAQQIKTEHGTAFRAGPANAIEGQGPRVSRIDIEHVWLPRTIRLHPLCVTQYDPPHMVSTFAALLSLAVLRDDFSRLDRAGVLRYLRSMQQADGSFAIRSDSTETDLRATYCVFVICHLLDDWTSIDVQRALAFIHRCKTYEGGYGQTPNLEAQGGTTFCAVASLHLYARSSASADRTAASTTSYEKQKDDDGSLVRWLVHRQIGGFQGRTGKVPDACYSFWCGGALKILGADVFVDSEANCAFLNACEFRFGGYAKSPDQHPDPFHTYMALAALSMYPPSATLEFRDAPRGDSDDDGDRETSGVLLEGEPPLVLRRLDVAVNATTHTADWARRHLRDR